MKVLHMNAGAEEGGGKTHIISLLSQFSKEEVELMVFEEGAIAREAEKPWYSSICFYPIISVRPINSFKNKSIY